MSARVASAWLCARRRSPSRWRARWGCCEAAKFQCANGQASRRLSWCRTLSSENNEGEDFRMESDPTVGWLAVIVIGGIAGWLAGWFVKTDMGLLGNVVLGMTGAFAANGIL